MKKPIVLLLAGFCVLLAGCARQTRSISHPAYTEDSGYRYAWRASERSDPAFAYRGELSEFDVLGLARGEVTSEAEIRRALDNAKQIKLHSGSSILLIQSGALLPDGPMVTELSRKFRVVPFTGVPPCRPSSSGRQNESLDSENYAKSLRLAAARGGAETIVCYWGMLESETENLATKTVSWVPVARWFVPDEKQHMRIRLKLALIDVRSGSWTLFSPKPFEDARLSTRPRRSVADQKQVELLKQQAYQKSARDLVRLYADSNSSN